MRRKTIDLLIICFFIALILFGVIYLVFLKKEARMCLNDPLSYAREKIGDNNVQCYCMDYKDPSRIISYKSNSDRLPS